MFGWLRAEAARASFLNRINWSGKTLTWKGSSLSATSRSRRSVAREVDFTHPAGAEELYDAVWAEGAAAKCFSLPDSNCAATSTAGDSMNVRFWSLNTSSDSSSSLNAVSAAQAQEKEIRPCLRLKFQRGVVELLDLSPPFRCHVLGPHYMPTAEPSARASIFKVSVIKVSVIGRAKAVTLLWWFLWSLWSE